MIIAINVFMATFCAILSVRSMFALQRYRRRLAEVDAFMAELRSLHADMMLARGERPMFDRPQRQRARWRQ